MTTTQWMLWKFRIRWNLHETASFIIIRKCDITKYGPANITKFKENVNRKSKYYYSTMILYHLFLGYIRNFVPGVALPPKLKSHLRHKYNVLRAAGVPAALSHKVCSQREKSAWWYTSLLRLVKLFGHHRYHPLPLIAGTVTKARLHIVLKESLQCQLDCSLGILQPPHGLFPVISVYPGDLTKITAFQTDNFRHLAGYALELYSCGENLAPKNDCRQLKVSSSFS